MRGYNFVKYQIVMENRRICAKDFNGPTTSLIPQHRQQTKLKDCRKIRGAFTAMVAKVQKKEDKGPLLQQVSQPQTEV
jgi:hypothetical protein